jgi:tRNA modification GTPase
MSRDLKGCHVAVLTALGRGAIATVDVRGADATRLMTALFHPVRSIQLADVAPGEVLFGRWGVADAGEEVVVCRNNADAWEVHCHGGDAAPRAIVQSLLDRGARRIAWRDWLQQQSADRLAGQARIALASARTSRTAAVLLDQYRGALRRGLEEVAGDVEASRWLNARKRLLGIQQYADVGIHLTRCWRVVIAGRANVGKSSLANALLGFERAIVYDQPGTTRDVLRWSTALDGWPIELIDTAGLRPTTNVVESAGMQRARQQMHGADLVLMVYDASIGWTEEEESLIAGCTRVVRVGNKRDLMAAHGTRSEGELLTSAIQRQGLEELSGAIVAALIPHPPLAGHAVPFLQEHAEAIQAALKAVEQNHRAAALGCLQSLLH